MKSGMFAGAEEGLQVLGRGVIATRILRLGRIVKYNSNADFADGTD